MDVFSNRGSWVGILPDTRGVVEDEELAVERGDTVLLFTDGLTEASNLDGEMFGQDRLVKALAGAAGLPLEKVATLLLDEVARFQAVQDDDMTLMLVRREA